MFVFLFNIEIFHIYINCCSPGLIWSLLALVFFQPYNVKKKTDPDLFIFTSLARLL